MPAPAEIANGPYHLVGTFPFTVGQAGAENRAQLRDRTFHAYIELYFQGKHDGKIRAYCAENRITTRVQDGTQVERTKKNRGNDTFGFYEDKAEVACTRVAKEMGEKWAANKTNSGVYVRGQKNIMAVQGERMSDGYGYDISFWYSGADIYVTFHCYPK